LRAVIDIEANGLYNPTKIWVVVGKDIDNGNLLAIRGDDGLWWGGTASLMQFKTFLIH